MNGTVPWAHVRRASALVVGAALLAPIRVRAQEASDSLARVEGEYAVRLAAIGDAAIHRLDFFPAKAQLRLQMALADPRSLAGVPFRALADRASRAATALQDDADHFETVTPSEDLAPLHRALIDVLRNAGDAAAHLANAAAACEADRASDVHCATPIAAASSELARTYRRYIDVRRRIADQVTDTGTRLIAFTPAR
jgi:hypothetical protein